MFTQRSLDEFGTIEFKESSRSTTFGCDGVFLTSHPPQRFRKVHSDEKDLESAMVTETSNDPNDWRYNPVDQSEKHSRYREIRSDDNFGDNYLNDFLSNTIHRDKFVDSKNTVKKWKSKFKWFFEKIPSVWKLGIKVKVFGYSGGETAQCFLLDKDSSFLFELFASPPIFTPQLAGAVLTSVEFTLLSHNSEGPYRIPKPEDSQIQATNLLLSLSSGYPPTADDVGFNV
jgi:hypothetical protein